MKTVHLLPVSLLARQHCATHRKRLDEVFSAKVRAMNLTSAQLYFRLLGYVKPYWRTFAISIIAMALTAANEPLLPALLKPMLDGTFIHKDDTVIQLAPLILLLFFFVRGIA